MAHRRAAARYPYVHHATHVGRASQRLQRRDWRARLRAADDGGALRSDRRRFRAASRCARRRWRRERDPPSRCARHRLAGGWRSHQGHAARGAGAHGRGALDRRRRGFGHSSEPSRLRAGARRGQPLSRRSSGRAGFRCESEGQRRQRHDPGSDRPPKQRRLERWRGDAPGRNGSRGAGRHSAILRAARRPGAGRDRQGA